MRRYLIILFALSPLCSICQKISEADLSEQAKEINRDLQGTDIGYGVTVKGCLSLGRTLVYQYNVPENWFASENLKTEVLANLKKKKSAKLYLEKDIDLSYEYYKKGVLVENISIKSTEFSNLTIELGSLISIKDHPKAKEINMQIRGPKGWELKEGDRPNIVKKFVMDGNSFMIVTKENETFFSREKSRQLLKSEDFLDDYIEELSTFVDDLELIDSSIVTLDFYPAAQVELRGKIEQAGIEIHLRIESWLLLYEDKIISLQGMGLDNREFSALSKLYLLVANSVLFPDQYE